MLFASYRGLWQRLVNNKSSVKRVILTASSFFLSASVLVFALLQLANAQHSKYLLDFTCVIIVIIIITITKLSILIGYQLP